VNCKYENNCLTLFLSGRIDTANSEAVEQEIRALRAENPSGSLSLDLEGVEYISSTGLRVLLRLRKSEGSLRLVNVPAEVYEILDMTGFTELMTVEKALRRLDITLCEKIGEGSNGVVYRYTDDIIVKVYKKPDALDEIRRERELARKALVLGVNTAIPYDVVRVGESYGTIFELLRSKSLSKLILAEPEKRDEYIKIYTDMLREIHATKVPEGMLPAIRSTYCGYARYLRPHLPEEKGVKLARLIDAVPDSLTMIHGDYHTNNVRFANGEAVLIDMDTLAAGDPIFEFASIFIAYLGFNMMDPHASAKFLRLEGELCSEIYCKLLRGYFRTDDAERLAELDRRIRLLGTTRLLRRTIKRQPDDKKNIEILKNTLCELLESVDSLSIT